MGDNLWRHWVTLKAVSARILAIFVDKLSLAFEMTFYTLTEQWHHEEAFFRTGSHNNEVMIYNQ